MEKSNMKNMVVLRNLPSNIVEEAIVVLKSNKKVKKLEKVEQQKKINQNEEEAKGKNYILKEAEMLVNNYISKVENKNEEKEIKKNKKYLRLRKYNLIITTIAILEFIGLLIS